MHQFSAHAIFAIVSAVGVALSKREFAFALFLYPVFVRIVIRLRLIKTSPNRYSRATWPKKKNLARCQVKDSNSNLQLRLGHGLGSFGKSDTSRGRRCKNYTMPNAQWNICFILVCYCSCCCWCCCLWLLLLVLLLWWVLLRVLLFMLISAPLIYIDNEK